MKRWTLPGRRDGQRIDKIETYRAFANRVWKIRETASILKDYKARGKTVFAFGAPQGQPR